MSSECINEILLNVARTEVLAVGICQKIAKLDLSGGMVVSGFTIPFGKKLQVLGVMLDNYLKIDDHITFCPGKQLSPTPHRPLVSKETANTIM